MSPETNDLQQEAEHFAGLLYGIDQLALLLDIPEDELRVAVDTRTILGRSILRGWLRSESEYRTSVIRHAKQGSTAAQNIVRSMLDTMQR